MLDLRTHISKELRSYFPQIQLKIMEKQSSYCNDEQNMIEEFIQYLPPQSSESYFIVNNSCLTQEMKIQDLLIIHRGFDLYQEIKDLNPSLDLKNFSSNQIENMYQSLKKKSNIVQFDEEEIENNNDKCQSLSDILFQQNSMFDAVTQSTLYFDQELTIELPKLNQPLIFNFIRNYIDESDNFSPSSQSF